MNKFNELVKLTDTLRTLFINMMKIKIFLAYFTDMKNDNIGFFNIFFTVYIFSWWTR